MAADPPVGVADDRVAAPRSPVAPPLPAAPLPKLRRLMSRRRCRKVLVANEFGELDPRVDLFVGGVLREVRCPGAHALGELGRDVDALEDGVEELGDDAAALVGGRLGQSIHAVNLFRGHGRGWNSPAGQGPQCGALHAEQPDLGGQHVSVRRRDGRQIGLLFQHPADRGEVQTQFAQRPDELQPDDGRAVVAPVARRRARGLGYQAQVRVVPDRLDRQPGPPGHLADVHETDREVSSHGRLKLVFRAHFRRPTRA